MHGTTLLIFLSIAGILCWFGPPVFVLMELDPLQYVLDDFVLPHFYNRTIPDILGTFALRTFFMAICGQEFMRTAMIFIYAVLVVSFGVISVVHKLRLLKSSKICVQLYSRLQIIFKACELIISIVAFCILCGAQSGTVVSLWIVVNAWHILPISALIITFFIGTGLFLFSALMLPTLAKVGTETSALLLERRNKHFMTSRNVRCANLYNYCLWTAHQPIDVPCLGLFTLGPECTRDYLNFVINNVVNLSLLWNPEVLGLSQLNE